MGCDDDRDNTVPGRTGIVAGLGPLDLRSRRPEPRHVRVSLSGERPGAIITESNHRFRSLARLIRRK